MQNSYFFFRFLVPRLSRLLEGCLLVSSFSQEKDELILEFNNGKQSFFLRVIFSPSLSVIVFPESFKRARNNSADIFPAALMGKVTSLQLLENERTFIIHLNNGCDLLFRMHGPSGNVLLVSGDSREVFRNSLKADHSSDTLFSGRSIDWSWEFFEANHPTIEKHYFTFGREIWKWLKFKGYDTAPVRKKYELIISCLNQMERSEFFLCRSDDSLLFSLLPIGNAEPLGEDPLRAVNNFYQVFIRESAFLTLKRDFLRRQEGKITQLESSLSKHKNRLKAISGDTHFREWADLIMANLHAIESGTKTFRAERFTEPGFFVDVRLKPELSPQKNAEVYYRKARNREGEVLRLTNAETELAKQLLAEQERKARIMVSASLQELKEFEADFKNAPARGEKKRLPYLEYECLEYKILVGRSSVDNDELTFRVASKEDLWLHVRDVAGSHVVIRNKPGQTIPKPVIERAAALAAFHSKRKGESLCPVAYTRRKHVRKRKGDPPGMVVVEREEVIMIEPAA